MKIEILGAHLTEITNAKLSALLIDEVLALDAGSLCSSLTISAQQKLKAILLTHYHYDHVRDIPILAMNLSYQGGLEIYSIPATFDVLSSCLLNGKIYPNFLEWPAGQPALKFIPIAPYQPFSIDGYNLLAVPMNHTVPTVGYQVTSPKGKKIFYSGDTGVGLSSCWEHISPDLLITEVSLPQRMEEWALKVAHLTPQLLKSELLKLRQIKGYIPPTLVVHINPSLESEIEKEVAQVAGELGVNITLGKEEMKVHL